MNYRSMWNNPPNGDFGNEQFYTDIRLDSTLALKISRRFLLSHLRVVRKDLSEFAHE
jgi:hypothetical protein